MFKNTYNALPELGLAAMPLWLIPVWLAISLQLPVFPHRARILEQALLALERTNLTETGLRLCCHKLIQYFYSLAEDDRARVVNRLHILLTHTGWYGWQWIANDVIRRNIAPTLRALILRGIETLDSDEAALRICRAVLETNPTSNERTTVAHLLKRALPTVEWADVARSLMENGSPGVAEAARDWLTRHVRSREIVFCLGWGLRNQYWKLRETGIRWAREWHTLENANYVLEPLMSGTPQDEKVLEWCKAWVSVTSHDSSFMLARIIRLRPDLTWPMEYVFTSLLRTVALGTAATLLIEAISENPSHAPGFAQACREWVDRASVSDPHWPRVWHAYRSAARERNELSELGFMWLSEASASHAEWSNVWNELWDCAFRAADLISLAQNWLRNVLKDNSRWGFIWKEVWEAGVETPEMQNLAIRWLTTADPRNAAWSYVWTKLIEIPTLAEELKAQGIEWLRSIAPLGRSWAIVWGMLSDPRRPDGKLAELGYEYLQRSMRHFESWARIWGALWRWRFEREQLVGLGMLWLDASLQRDNTQWPYVFSTLAQSDLTHELAQLGAKWLASAAAANTGWNHVWQPLFNLEPRPPEVNRLGLEWLRATKDEDHSGWAQVWCSMHRDAPESEELTELGYRWMAEHLASRQWVHVWSAFCGTFDQESAASRTLLLTIGRRRLQQTSQKLGEWGQIWRLLIKLMPEDPSLVAIGLRLVQKTYSDSINWGLVWHTLMKIPEYKPALLDLACSWLLRHRPYPTDWHEIWFTVSRERPLSSKEISAGLHWLGRRSAFGASHWAEIWDAVAQRRRNDRKVALYAQEWMQSDYRGRASEELLGKMQAYVERTANSN